MAPASTQMSLRRKRSIIAGRIGMGGNALQAPRDGALAVAAFSLRKGHKPHEYPRIPGQGTAGEVRHRHSGRRCGADRGRSGRGGEEPRPARSMWWWQDHAGGRGKGKFKELGAEAKGGVRLAKSVDEVEANAREMLGNTLVTIQTGDAGKQVNRLYVTDGVDIASEYYLSMLVDRATGRVAMIVSTEGGMDIETVAHDTPDLITTITIDPATGFMPHHGRAVAFALKLSGDLNKQAQKLAKAALHRLHHARLRHAGDQPKGRNRGWQPPGPRHQDELRFQRALPPQGRGSPARRDRGRPDGGRGLQV